MPKEKYKREQIGRLFKIHCGVSLMSAEIRRTAGTGSQIVSLGLSFREHGMYEMCHF
jgi:hypothetical protein